ncbi:MAG: fructose-6-phosphate aldolase [Oscillospiraceae bacterium]|nr:fructose-6-phosphate aldolase [Oscillospiraceae bacterium]MDD4413344.1 fructose-6-phosphate aldolase [Oscillospiraceae bacterium]
MKIFIDTANVEEIKNAYALGIVEGVTTNPSIIAREGKKFEDAIKEISGIVGDETYIFGEVIGLEADKMVKEAHEISKLHKKMIIKIPMCAEGLKAVSLLKKDGIRTCVTLCFSAGQALLASNAGAAFVAPFLGRVDDIGWDGLQLVSEIAEMFAVQDIKTQIVAASTRNPLHVIGLAKCGCDVATVPYKIIMQMIEHPLTRDGLQKFLKDWESVPKN